MTEWEKAQQGYLYDASYDQEIVDARTKCADLCYAFNACRPSDVKTQEKLIREMFGEIRGSFTITAPFYCDYGSNISIGDNFLYQSQLYYSGWCKGDIRRQRIYCAELCIFYSRTRIDARMRAEGMEIALPITVGNRVWIGANVSVLPGVTIGDDTVIGAGSVVNKDIPGGVVAAGNPCRVIRKITEADKQKYPIWKE